jgi:hypothetical protein
MRRNLTFDQINAIPKGFNATHQQVWEEIAPYITGWNLTALNIESGEVEPVPPPAEAGPDVFRALDSELSAWLISWMRTIHVGGPGAVADQAESARKKGLTPSVATPEPSGDETSG